MAYLNGGCGDFELSDSEDEDDLLAVSLALGLDAQSQDCYSQPLPRRKTAAENARLNAIVAKKNGVSDAEVQAYGRRSFEHGRRNGGSWRQVIAGSNWPIYRAVSEATPTRAERRGFSARSWCASKRQQRKRRKPPPAPQIQAKARLRFPGRVFFGADFKASRLGVGSWAPSRSRQERQAVASHYRRRQMPKSDG